MRIASDQIFHRPSGTLKPGCLTFKGGRVTEMLWGKTNQQKIDHDLTGLCILPPAIDLHVHARDFEESHKETFESYSEAASRGGVGLAACMANTRPTLDSVERIQEFFKRTKPYAIEMIPYASVSKGLLGAEPTNWHRLLKMKIAGLSDDGKPIVDEKMMTAVMKEVSRAKKILSLHEEDRSISNGAILATSQMAKRFGVAESPREAEIAMVKRDLMLARKHSCSVHFAHLSAAESVQLVRAEKKKNARITCEACFHHLLLALDDSTTAHLTDVRDLSRFKVCPPVRLSSDRAALQEGLRSGVIDVLSSDHAPHSQLEKEAPIELAAHGMISAEAHFSLAFEVKQHARLSWRRFVEVWSDRAAGLLNRSPYLEVGAEARWIAVDLSKKRKLEFQISKSKNTPWVSRVCQADLVAHYAIDRFVWGHDDI